MEEINSISFTPHDDDTLARFSCPLTEGKATAVVVEEKFGKNDNHWMLLTFEVTDTFGKTSKIKDFFGLGDRDLWRYKRFCECARRPDLYAKGKIQHGDRIGLTVEVDIEWKKTGKYPGMKIAEYLLNENTAKVLSDFYSKKHKLNGSNEPNQIKDEDLDDDIPF